MNDMIKYIYIRDNSKIVTEKTERGTKIFLESDLDKAIFDIPVTIIVDEKAYNIALGEEIYA
jgi:hypothetical protein